MVRFEKVSKSYDGEKFIVNDLNLNIDSGQFLTMLGPSGSGKTTCLMLLAGFEDLSGGEIFINDVPVKSIAPYKRNIGMVFQNYALFPHLTVWQNLAYPLKFRGHSRAKIKKQVSKYIELVELGDFGSRYPNQLSGGQKQRVALARSMVYEPQLILMDEPLGALDKNLREQMQFEIKKLHDLLKFTVVYVTHDQTEALTMSDQIAVFNNGKIQQLSTPSSLYENPENKFVAEFIGENNKLIAKVVKKEKNKITAQVNKHKIISKVFDDSLTINSDVYISIRPEKIIIGKNHSKLDNKFKAKVSDIIYIGDHIRLYVTIEDIKAEFVIKQQDPHETLLKKGDLVDIGFSAVSCNMLKPI